MTDPAYTPGTPEWIARRAAIAASQAAQAAATDHDIVMLNGHVHEYQGSAGEPVSVGQANGALRVMAANEATSLIVADPEGPDDASIELNCHTSGATINFQRSGQYATLSLNSAGRFQMGCDLRFFMGGTGVILASPNGTEYRLKVANDGTLSTELVT